MRDGCGAGVLDIDGQSGPIYSVQAFVSAYTDPTGAQSFDTGAIPGPTATAGPIDLVSGAYGASIFAQASYGHLTGNAFATNPFFAGAAQATTFADNFTDTLTIHSAVLPNGSPVVVLAKVTFTDQLISQGDTGVGNAGIQGTYSLSGLAFDDRGSPNSTVSYTHTGDVLLMERVEVSFLIGAGLGFDASARPGMGQLTADARFTLDVQTPDAFLGSASGTSYASQAAVPEPSSFVLLLFAGLWGAGRLRTRRDRPAA